MSNKCASVNTGMCHEGGGRKIQILDQQMALFPRLNRAKYVTEEVVHKYFENLKGILTKYDLLEFPHLIFNIDETGFSPEHIPPKILTKKGKTPNAITSPKSTMVTCIGASNAVGNSVPIFLIFKGKRQNDDIKQGPTPG